MEVKGAIFKGINDFMSIQHTARYAEWTQGLSEEAKPLITKAKDATWYSIQETLVKPTQLVSKLLSVDEKKAAWDMGRFSAEQNLTGIYKVFMIVSTPTFMLKRASRILGTFYTPCNMEVTGSTDRSVVITCTELPIRNHLIENRIAGWIERAGELCGCENLELKITSSIAAGKPLFVIKASWK